VSEIGYLKTENQSLSKKVFQMIPNNKNNSQKKIIFEYKNNSDYDFGVGHSFGGITDLERVI